MKSEPRSEQLSPNRSYSTLVSDVTRLVSDARRSAARTLDSLLIRVHWEIGRSIVEFEQEGAERARYGTRLLESLSQDLTRRLGKGFSPDNLEWMRRFYREFPISETASRKSGPSDPPNSSASLARRFILSWSHYVALLSIGDAAKRRFYERGCSASKWTVRQLKRHIRSGLFERSRVSGHSAPVDESARARRDCVRMVKDPYVLEFLDMPTVRSERGLEDALIEHMTEFLLELGCGFTFVARQKRLQVGEESFYLDLLFYHRGLRCLVAVDLKLGRFSPADAGQMNLYLNCLREQEMLEGEAPPIGILLCSQKSDTVARFALGGLANHVFASTYRLSLPNPDTLRREVEAERRRLESRS